MVRIFVIVITLFAFGYAALVLASIGISMFDAALMPLYWLFGSIAFVCAVIVLCIGFALVFKLWLNELE